MKQEPEAEVTSAFIRVWIFFGFILLLMAFVLLWTLMEADEVHFTRSIGEKLGRKITEWLPMKDFSKFVGNYLKEEMVNISPIPMDDPRLLTAIRNHFIIPPSSLPFNIKHVKFTKEGKDGFDVNEESPSSPNEAFAIVSHILKTFNDDPFYVEYGANKNKNGSNSLRLEKMGWTGLLIGADAEAFEKHQKAYSGHFCLSNTKHPQIANFHKDKHEQAFSNTSNRTNEFATTPASVQCFPLVSVLLAMERPVVDFFSLRIEENVSDILNTVDFNLVFFKVLAVENLFGNPGDREIKSLMENNGYIHYADVNLDCIFIHHTVQI